MSAYPEIQQLFEVEDGTKQNTGAVINVGINYGGRKEITHAARALAQQVADGKLLPQQINEELLAERLLQRVERPDFILRPSGKRLSNFMLWQAAYSEFVYMDVLWPDFTRKNLDRQLPNLTAAAGAMAVPNTHWEEGLPMKTRVITSLVSIPILFLALYFYNAFFFNLIVRRFA